MKRLSSLGFSLLVLSTGWVISIYTYSVQKIEGGNQSLSAYQGKKILIVTLPIQQSASADTLLYCLDTLAAAHSTDLKVIAVPSREDGYTPSIKNQLKQWYRTKLGDYIIIADGIYSRKTSGSDQHGLFRWLTTVGENEYFNMDVTGPWFKFFVKTNGELYGVLGPQTRISNISVNKTLRML